MIRQLILISIGVLFSSAGVAYAQFTEVTSEFSERSPGNYLAKLDGPASWSIYGVASKTSAGCFAVKSVSYREVLPPYGIRAVGEPSLLLGSGIVVSRQSYYDSLSNGEAQPEENGNPALILRPIRNGAGGSFQFRFKGDKFFETGGNGKPLLSDMESFASETVDFDAHSYKYPTIQSGYESDSVEIPLTGIDQVRSALLQCEDIVKSEFPTSNTGLK